MSTPDQSRTADRVVDVELEALAVAEASADFEAEVNAESEAETRLRAAVRELAETSGVTQHHSLIERIVSAGIGMGQDQADLLNLKIVTAAVEEMRAAFKVFEPYRGTPKVTIFGSARTQGHDPLWKRAESAARGLADQGWMVVTGAGPGIMEAAAVGAGSERSLGVSIRLPFEETPNQMVDENDGRSVAMKYFFTRKLMLVKESSGFVCLPGGFGTMDETFELLTLQQTGKMVPVPIVLLDRPGGTFWRGFERFVIDELEGAGVVTPGDLDRVLITDSVEEAVAEVAGFWSNYDSLRWVGSRLVLRMRTALSDAALEQINRDFADLVDSGTIERTEPLRPEVKDDDSLDLHRLVFTPRPRRVGELHRLIRALNAAVE
ncbi:LOG family protein [Leucobacter sp. GX24907]